MRKAKVLVVDDEAKIVDLVRVYLEKEDYQVVTAGDGRQALETFEEQKPDLIVLDLMLPQIDGLEVCRSIRRRSATPIIMLTARSEDMDKLTGLGLGADDYVTKPFSPRELVARVTAVLRRTRGGIAPARRIVAASLVIDTERHEVTCHGRPVEVTPTEFKLLSALAGNPGRVFTRLQLLDLVQGEAYEGYERTIDAHIKNLRRKLTHPETGDCRLTTVHGVGYKFDG
ncbi:MAG: response regulator transcription factor [Chloroflexi bacterium]|nr:response regulator transcription factor [Chloroflexota bacterium]